MQERAREIIEALQNEQAALQEEGKRLLRQKTAELDAERAAKQTLEQRLNDVQACGCHGIPARYHSKRG